MTTATKLPSGKAFTVKAGTGRDLLTAQKMVEDPTEVSFALIACLATVDGQDLTVEDVLDRTPLSDVMALLEQLTSTKAKEPDELPSGKKFAIRDGLGRDLLKAQRLANDPNEVGFALVSVLATVGGEQLHLDEVIALPLPDVMKLLEAVTGKRPIQAPSASPS